MRRHSTGFTVIELLVVAVFLGTAAVILLIQINTIRSESINKEKKTAINAMYYGLEESFYKEHKYYPETLADNTLTTMDSALLTDPNGVKIGDSSSDYRYESRNCTDGKCKAYTLRTTLHNEGDYVKESRNK